MVPLDASWEDVVGTVTASPFSRLPVYAGSRDHIVGMLRVKDLVERYTAEGPVRLDRLLRPVVIVAESLPADRAITELRERRVHSAIVADANGGAVGLVTIQDLLGALLGAPSDSGAS
jgi:putative hemolysin